jgi:hypothetical protein
MSGIHIDQGTPYAQHYDSTEQHNLCFLVFINEHEDDNIGVGGRTLTEVLAGRP